MKEFLLPDPGEGLVEAEIVAWHVAEGDHVKVNDVVLEVETSKSIVELPIPWTGTVARILVAAGQTVPVGTPIVVIDDGAQPEQEDDKPEPLLVGYGAAPSSGRHRRSRARSSTKGNGAANAHQAVADAYGQSAPSRRPDDVHEPHRVQAEPHGDPLPTPGDPARGTDLVLSGVPDPTLAKPPVRKLAKQLGVDLDTVVGTGPQGSITRADVEAAAALAALGAMGSAPRVEERSSTGERRIPIKGVRKVTAEAMIASTSTHVHVTEWVTIDITATMEMVERLRARREFANLRVSPLLLYAKACCLAMANTPEINASWDEDNQEIVLHGDVNLGIAAATPRGLMVPNIKGAQQMNLLELCRAINALVQVSKEGKLQPADYGGGTFTITNVGVFGVESGTPIINGNESAILCMGSIDRKPWVVGEGADERVEPRWVTTISISFDHRLIDGEQGSRFLREVADLLQDPELAMLY
ncbi:2-oxo acid dehydrogenase subunit E2 [Aestuariimicrobium sp. p3-SID1156]|uniref:dihydrolipoamide acetyltransferase family protein n=1 Tax=Aestuariimicrobium sp. p3-SID1156 TaxID=2916038 RepID=UPI00223B3FDA|nr:dihydrolipoamide acetyltransferase family protein [Aestuariimicrobium sp. p3-SID1156]MCT1458156.1 2-oxo acid dehydrogenase subunit E2 [Aestuariimicrobium sp. p3-SID1156]